MKLMNMLEQMRIKIGTKRLHRLLKKGKLYVQMDDDQKTKNQTVCKIKDKTYSILNRGGTNAEKNEESNHELAGKNRTLVDGRRLLNKELDNSSFYYDKINQF